MNQIETSNYHYGAQSVLLDDAEADDNDSTHSQSSSCNWSQQPLYTANVGAASSESDTCGPQVSVRDMIKRYNTAIQNNSKISDVVSDINDEKLVSHRSSNQGFLDDGNYKPSSKQMHLQQNNTASLVNSARSSTSSRSVNNETGKHSNRNGGNNKTNCSISSTSHIGNVRSIPSQTMYCRNCSSCVFCQENQPQRIPANEMFYEEPTTKEKVSFSAGISSIRNKNTGNEIHHHSQHYKHAKQHSATAKCHKSTATFSKCDCDTKSHTYPLNGKTSNMSCGKQSVHMGKETPALFEPRENSYQSKTTIAKTSNGESDVFYYNDSRIDRILTPLLSLFPSSLLGIRIIIDIYFDNPECALRPIDVVGNRIETDIPKSRILDHFQKHQAAMVN